MDKIDFDRILKYSEFEEMRKQGHFEENLEKKGIVPVVFQDKLFIYKITKKKEIGKLMHDIDEKYTDISYNITQYRNYKPFNKVIDKRATTAEEFMDLYKLGNEEEKKLFCKKYAEEIEVKVPYDEEIYIKGYRMERFEEVVDRMRKKYSTYTIKKSSKLFTLLSIIDKTDHYDIDFIITILYQFLHLGTEKCFYTTCISCISDDIVHMPFSDSEKKLTYEERLLLVKDFIEVFDIECVYSKEVEKLTDLYIGILGTIEYERLFKFANKNRENLLESGLLDLFKAQVK